MAFNYRKNGVKYIRDKNKDVPLTERESEYLERWRKYDDRCLKGFNEHVYGNYICL